MAIDTQTLLRNLRSARSVDAYLDTYDGEMLDTDVPQHLKRLLSEQGVSLAAMAERSELGDYAYKLFSGARTATRDKLLALSIGLELRYEQTQRLLRVGGCALLDPRRRDAVVIYALENKLSVARLNELLFEVQEATV